jgi:membrane-associated protease RseP (regulator of RpoE activity)
MNLNKKDRFIVMSQTPGMQPNPELEPNVTACSNCHTPMPSGLRFCRNCGFRLGEGPAEYTETVRFQPGNNPASVAARTTAAHDPLVTSYGLSSGNIAQTACQIKRRKLTGMTWIFLGLLLFFLTAGVFTAIFSPARRHFGGVPPEVKVVTPPRSYVGVDGFESADGGVTFDNVEPPGSPADKAGLVGGDIITTFDGQTIDDEDDMSDLLVNTPVGKTVDVVFIRDGETKTTKLTTVSKEEFDRMAADFRKRPEGRGLFGYENDECQRVQVPNSKMFGVKLGSITQNRPADLSGIKKGDIVIAFDDTPIRTKDELLSRVYRALPYSTVKVTLMRDGERIVVPVKMGKQ